MTKMAKEVKYFKKRIHSNKNNAHNINIREKLFLLNKKRKTKMNSF